MSSFGKRQMLEGVQDLIVCGIEHMCSVYSNTIDKVTCQQTVLAWMYYVDLPMVYCF